MDRPRQTIPALHVDERLRPFLDLGLSYILMDAPVASRYADAAPFCESTPGQAAVRSAPSRANAQQAFRTPPAPHAHPAAHRMAPPRPAPQADVRTSPQPAASASSGALRDRLPPFPDARYAHLAPDSWPPFFQEQWRKIRGWPPILWTYPELGADLAGLPSAGRGQFLRDLNARLHLRAGSCVYWPLHAPDGGEIAPNAPVFLAGLERLAPSHAIFFGEDAIAPLAPDRPATPFSFFPRFNTLVLMLPPIMELANDAQLLARAVAFLGPHLAPLRR